MLTDKEQEVRVEEGSEHGGAAVRAEVTGGQGQPHSPAGHGKELGLSKSGVSQGDDDLAPHIAGWRMDWGWGRVGAVRRAG